MFIQLFASRIRKNPRAAASVYFVIVCLALSALLTTKRTSTSSKRHQHHRSFELVEQHELHDADDAHHQHLVVAHRHDSGHRVAMSLGEDDTVDDDDKKKKNNNTEEEVEEEVEEKKDMKSALILTVAMLILSAICAGLTLGIMGLDTVTLEVIADAAPEPDRTYARKLLPVRHLGHQTLCTLIVTNMFCNVVVSTESGDILPEHPDTSGGKSASSALIAFFLSTFLILIFAEILPMAICTGPNALKIAAASVPLVKVLLVLVYPIAKPLGWALDKLLHHDPGQIYDREELKKLFTMHAQTHQAVSGLKTSELDLLLGAFDFGDKRVNDIMTPFETVIVLRSDAVLDAELLRLLWSTGHSRIPVVDANKLPQPKTNSSRRNKSGNSNNNSAFNEEHASSWDGTKDTATTTTTNNNNNNHTDDDQQHELLPHNKSQDQLAARQAKRHRNSALTIQDLKIPADMLHHVHIVGILFVKDLLLVMDQNLTVEEVLEMFPHGDVFSVWHGAHLRNLLTSFQQGQCHLVVVRENKFQVSLDEGEDDEDSGPAGGARQASLSRSGSLTAMPEQQRSSSYSPKKEGSVGSPPQSPNTPTASNNDPHADYENLCYVQPEDRAIGIITLEALIETLIRAPIWDEHDDEEEENKQREQLMMSHFHPAEMEQQQQQQQQQQQTEQGNNVPSAIASEAAAASAQPGSPAATQHAVSRARHQLKSVHFFDFAVSRDEVRNISEGTAVRAPPLTAAQCSAIGRYLLSSVDSFSVFGDVTHLAKLIVGSDCYLVNPRRPDPDSFLEATSSELKRNSEKLAHAPVVKQSVLQSAFHNKVPGQPQAAAAVQLAVKGHLRASSATPAGHDEYDHHHSGKSKGQQQQQQPTQAAATAALLTAPVSHHPPMTPAAAAAAASASFLEAITPDTTIYTRNQRSVYFTLILGGSVRIIAGRERFHSDVHTMSWLGERALESPDGFVPTFDAFALTPCRLLRISSRSFTAVRQVAMMSVAANTVARSLVSSNPQRYGAAVSAAAAGGNAKHGSSSEESAGGKDDIELLRVGGGTVKQ